MAKKSEAARGIREEGLEILRDVSLGESNTFRVDVRARYLVEIATAEDLERLVQTRIFAGERRLLLGRGANILFSGDFEGLVVKIGIAGRTIVHEDSEGIVLEIGAGEDWPKLVSDCVAAGWAGIENLAMVPGSVGAAPIQHVACYGQNLGDVFESLDAIDFETGRVKVFSKADCSFGYRTSVFRGPAGGRFGIARVRLRLSKNGRPDTSYHSRYESVAEELAKDGSGPYGIADVYRAVCRIRTRKLPAVEEYGTAGSFFKNPVVSRAELAALRRLCPGIQCYPVDQLSYPRGEALGEETEYVKVPAGWLIEECGLKGYRKGPCGVWPRQALTIVNYGGAKPAELLELVEEVRSAVAARYGIVLENEVEVI